MGRDDYDYFEPTPILLKLSEVDNHSKSVFLLALLITVLAVWPGRGWGMGKGMGGPSWMARFRVHILDCRGS